MDSRVTYVGKDLEAMDFAENYHRWILREFRPYIGRRIVEVGAGTGGFSKLLLDTHPESITLVEPSEMADRLTENIEALDLEGSKPEILNNIFIDVSDRIAANDPDTVLYVNVLEHIEDDSAELAAVHRTLTKGGHCLIFVPAFMSLYGPFDKQVGHFRRYDKANIEELCKDAGFKVIKSVFFDGFGVVPWWIKYRLLKSNTLGGRSVKLYDRVVVPILEKVEGLKSPPIGKNILLVAQK